MSKPMTDAEMEASIEEAMNNDAVKAVSDWYVSGPRHFNSQGLRDDKMDPWGGKWDGKDYKLLASRHFKVSAAKVTAEQIEEARMYWFGEKMNGHYFLHVPGLTQFDRELAGVPEESEETPLDDLFAEIRDND